MLKRGYKQLVEDALGRIHTLSVDEARTNSAIRKSFSSTFARLASSSARALFRAFNAPRGMLEFWVDPESPYHKEVFAPGKHFVLYCQSAWRSALATATLLDMGLTSVSHIEGGFSAWKQAGGPRGATEEVRTPACGCPAGQAQKPVQCGFRFSRNAPMPSSASRASIFSTMTQAA